MKVRLGERGGSVGEHRRLRIGAALATVGALAYKGTAGRHQVHRRTVIDAVLEHSPAEYVRFGIVAPFLPDLPTSAAAPRSAQSGRHTVTRLCRR